MAADAAPEPDQTLGLGCEVVGGSDIPEFMRVVSPRGISGILCACLTWAALAVATPACAVQADQFRWMDFHGDKDQDVIVWVTRALAAEKWTAIREIGTENDAALVVTTLRAGPDVAANADLFQVWSVSLTNHLLTPVLKGYNLRWVDWMTFKQGGLPEIPILYDSCAECTPDTYFTAFYYDRTQHLWMARWMRGGQGVPMLSGTMPAGVEYTQIYAGLPNPDGSEFLATWNHFDFGGQKPAQDYIYRYDIDPFSGLERTQLLNGKDADAMKLRLCRGDMMPGLAHGQDSALCQDLAGPRPGRKPVTTPPAHNRGQSTPYGAHQ